VSSIFPEDIYATIRLAIVAELDAISFYLQAARRVEDERSLGRFFKDVAREEQTHMGEFRALLKQLDPEQARELEKGFQEVSELLLVETTAKDRPQGFWNNRWSRFS